MIKLIQGDCLEILPTLERESVNMVLTDLPYGTTPQKWDNILPFDEMWDCLNPLVKDNAPMLFFGIEPFSSQLRVSNLKNYRYDWIWNKEVGTNFLNANRTPLPCHEEIMVFYRKAPYYNPQKRYVGIKYKKAIVGKRKNKAFGDIKERTPYVDDGYRFPLSIINCNKAKSEATNSKSVHPTQKPVKLLEYFIKTYTKEGDTVLDFTMGSGSTGVACLNTNRNFIGIELDEGYYNIAKDRCSNFQSTF